jgi:hypothetical protein
VLIEGERIMTHPATKAFERSQFPPEFQSVFEAGWNACAEYRADRTGFGTDDAVREPILPVLSLLAATLASFAVTTWVVFHFYHMAGLRPFWQVGSVAALIDTFAVYRFLRWRKLATERGRAFKEKWG